MQPNELSNVTRIGRSIASTPHAIGFADLLRHEKLVALAARVYPDTTTGDGRFGRDAPVDPLPAPRDDLREKWLAAVRTLGDRWIFAAPRERLSSPWTGVQS